ncbi:MAG: hypothetical protein HC767_14930, partial [Akkermansiaceae bacterium]|nr:hypothetical protein [Akkermansiaceae bacterium]
MMTTQSPFLLQGACQGLGTLSHWKQLQLSQPHRCAALGTPPTAVLTIRDNDFIGTIEFTSATFSVNEDAGAATIT